MVKNSIFKNFKNSKITPKNQIFKNFKRACKRPQIENIRKQTFVTIEND